MKFCECGKLMVPVNNVDSTQVNFFCHLCNKTIPGNDDDTIIHESREYTGADEAVIQQRKYDLTALKKMKHCIKCDAERVVIAWRTAIFSESYICETCGSIIN